MASEITHFLLKTDWLRHPDFYGLNTIETLTYLHCLSQGAKNNLGMFVSHRGGVALDLRLVEPEDKEIVMMFFEQRKDLIEFDPNTHLIWVKNLYDLVDFGIDKSIYKVYFNKESQKDEEGLDFDVLNTINRFATKINSVALKNRNIKDHPFLKKWVYYNKNTLLELDLKLKIMKNSNRGFDKLLNLIKP